MKDHCGTSSQSWVLWDWQVLREGTSEEEQGRTELLSDTEKQFEYP